MENSGPGEDATLVSLAQAGDGSAFAALYRTHAAAVAVAVRERVSDPTIVDDMVQEAFTKALERLGTLRDPERFRPWLLSIARNAAVDQRRRHRRLSLMADASCRVDVVDSRCRPDELAEGVELSGLIAACVASMSPRDARALAMVTHLGLGPSEVAVALGVRTGTAKVIVHRARARLRLALALEVLMRRHGGGCSEFEALRGAEAVRLASRHLRNCAQCSQLVRGEISGVANVCAIA
jgi:RNA polymerase sigma factor (sigma-70 family)